ncbi:DUF441 domain-containing protein [Sinanaerobacter chloroacetimidivorans]|uniref:UPF0756 membrane protein KCX82_04000 n=1 Tax=Sinanaerobacter chloroacetimidivorans TaxID=2818044 RepID=A0A8J7VXS6_9FIRM|nr:DUF441 family protein [Sinanaerobacter chloroacetimidivorans]MBR0597027.1 DUF441 family protein [Sinanaerobacter chloroacetimidivorans]
MSANIILLLIVAAALFGKANTVAIAAGVLLILKLMGLDRYTYPFIEKNGITYGIIILIAAILLPIANGTITVDSIKNIFVSWIGIAALVLSFITTYLSGQGLDFLTTLGHSEVMPSLIIGAVIAASLLNGLPVGPFITCGLLVVLMQIVEIFKN